MTENKANEIEIEARRTPNYQMIYVHGAFGTFTEYDYRLRFYNEVISGEDGKPIYEIPVTIVMSPVAAKELRDLLDRQIKEYEEKVGEIKKPDISALRQIE